MKCGECNGLGQVRDYCSSERCNDPHCTLVALHCPDCDGTGIDPNHFEVTSRRGRYP